MKRMRIHIRFDQSGQEWVVRREGSRISIAAFRTKEAAVDAARNLAKAAHGQLIVHLKNGRIQQKWRYGKRSVLLVAKKSLASRLTIEGGGYGGPRRGGGDPAPPR